MSWTAIYQSETGELLSLGTVVSGTLPAGVVAKDVGSTKPTGVWDTQTKEFVPVITPVVWTSYEFLKRFTSDERGLIRQLAKTDALAEDFMYLLDRASEVHQDNPDVLAGLNYLVFKGALIASRPSEILNG